MRWSKLSEVNRVEFPTQCNTSLVHRPGINGRGLWFKCEYSAQAPSLDRRKSVQRKDSFTMCKRML